MAVYRTLDRSSQASHQRVWDRAAILVYGSFAITVVAFLIVAPMEPTPPTLVIDTAMAVFNVAAFGLALRAATHRRLDRRTRWAWSLVTASYLLLVVAGYFFAAAGADQAFPGTADAFRLAFAPVLLAGLLCFPMRSHTRKDRYKLVLDIGTVVAGSFMLLWYLVIGPALSVDASSVWFVAAAVAYPAGDLVLVFGATTVLLRGAASSVRRPLSLLVTALAFEVAGDLYLGNMWENHVPPDWPFLCWLTGHFLMAAAAYEQCRLAPNHRLDPAGERHIGPLSPVRLLPYAAIVLGYALLLGHATAQALYPWGGLVTGAVVITLLVIARQLVVLRENHELVVTDSLTGLANRVRVSERLSRALTRAPRGDQMVGVLLVDLDGFKQINDTLGHEAGDEMLVAFSRLLERSAPHADTVGRLGGDEFAIVLEGIPSCDSAVTVARQIIAAAGAEPFMVLDQEIWAQASIGIAVSKSDSESPSELLHRADMAMYHAKRRQANSWQVYLEGMCRSGVTSAALEEDLREAVGAGQLRLRYQPIVELDTGEPVGLEALVRWEHPMRGHLSPQCFIPIAEQSTLIAQVGQWVLENACEQTLEWQRLLPGARRLQLSVNLSPRQLEDESLVSNVMAVLRRTGFAPNDLILEVTENALVDERSAVPRLRDLSSHGIRIALDDFGTGYSSLRYLTRLPVDILKLDRCFVSELNQTPEGSAVAQVVFRLSQVLGLETIAEGIENADQAAELSELGYRTGQGFYFSRPLAPDAAEALMTGGSNGRLHPLPAPKP